MTGTGVLNSVGATVTIDGAERESVTVNAGTTVHWSVSKEGYVTQEGDYTVLEDTVLPVVLKREEYTITFRVSPTDATLMVNGSAVALTDGKYTTTAKWGDTVSWSCEKEGYISQNGNFTADGDRAVNITLEAEKEVEPAIWFERDGNVIDTVNLDCTGDRIEVDVITSSDDVMWRVDEDQYGDWGATALYISPIQGTGTSKITIYRDMGDGGTLSAWSVGVMFHYGLTSSYESGTETLTVNRMECEQDYLYFMQHSMTFESDDYTAQTVEVNSNIHWTILTGITEYYPVFDITPTSAIGDAVMSISVTDESSPFIDTAAGYNFSLTIGKTDRSVTDTLQIHVRGKEDYGEYISFLDGMEFKVDDQTEGMYTAEHEKSFRIRTWGGVTRMQLDAAHLWMSELGGEWGLASVECNGQTLTDDGVFSLEANTEYTVTVKWHNWFCSKVSEMGLPYGIELELGFNAHTPEDTWVLNQVRIYTTNGGTGPYTP